MTLTRALAARPARRRCATELTSAHPPLLDGRGARPAPRRRRRPDRRGWHARPRRAEGRASSTRACSGRSRRRTARSGTRPIARRRSERRCTSPRTSSTRRSAACSGWSTRADAPVDDRKHVYAQAFAIYALAEHFRATGDEQSLRGGDRDLPSRRGARARRGARRLRGGVRPRLEAARRRAPQRARTERAEEHEHAPAPARGVHARCYAAWPDARLRASGSERCSSCSSTASSRPAGDHVIGFFTERLGAAFARRSRSATTSRPAGCSSRRRTCSATPRSPSACSAQPRCAWRARCSSTGVDAEHGGLFNERDGDRLDTDKEWWPQAEAIVGFLAAYQDIGRRAYLDAAASARGDFVRAPPGGPSHGEWLRRVSRSGDASRGGEKVGPWKCPYHNGRACLEVIARVDALLASEAGRVAV